MSKRLSAWTVIAVGVVAPGTYFEIIDFLGKAITLRSSGGPEVTIIDANFDGGPGVTCESGERADTVPCLESSRWSRANLRLRSYSVIPAGARLRPLE